MSAWRGLLALCALPVAGMVTPAAGGEPPAAAAWQILHPAVSQRPVKNPDGGLAFMPALQPVATIPAWVLDACSIAYFRLAWSDVVDPAGKPKFDELDRKVFAGYRAKGLRLAFRIMGANPHAESEYVTPKAVIERERLPTVAHLSVYGKPQRDPVCWDPRYVAAYNGLTRALGAYLDGQPWAGPVDLGGMGDWGEMHLERWTAAQLQANGFTGERYLRAVTAMMDEMDRSLPRTTKAFCVAPILMPDPGPLFAQLVDRATRRGWWLRSDGCTTAGPPPYVVPYVQEHWKTTGLICEPNGAINNSGDESAGEPAQRWLDANLGAHASLLNLMGLWDLKRFTVDEMRSVQLAALRAGPRFVAAEAVLPPALPRAADGRAWLTAALTLSQTGSAPFHGTALLEVDAGGTRQLVVPDPPLSHLLPGEARRIPILLELSASAAGGALPVKARLVDLDRGPLELGNDPPDAAGWLALGAVPAGDGKTLAPLFDLATARLDTAPGVSASRISEGVALRGTEEKGWSYGWALNGTPVDPHALYVMRVRVRARPGSVGPSRSRAPDTSSPGPGGTPGSVAGSALYFKFGIDDANGRWAGNVNTPKYDFAQAGTWQELTAVYRPRPGDTTLQLAAEKGRTAPSAVDAEIAAWTVYAVPVP